MYTPFTDGMDQLLHQIHKHQNVPHSRRRAAWTYVKGTGLAKGRDAIRRWARGYTIAEARSYQSHKPEGQAVIPLLENQTK